LKFLEPGVTHYINEIDSRDALDQGEPISREQRNLSETEIPFKIEKFPAQFKKSIFASFDKRFLFILLFSVAINVGTIVVLKNRLPSEVDSKTISKIQQQYAKLLLTNEVQPPSYLGKPVSDPYKLDTQLVTGLSRWMDTFTNNVLESIKELPTLKEPAPEPGPKETRLPSREQLGTARKSASAARRASKAELEKEVNSVGLLGLISSNARAIDREYVQDLLEYASENSNHLAQVLAKLNSIEVPRYGSNEYLKKLRRSTAAEAASGLKGGRTNVDGDVKAIIDNVEPLKSVGSKPMKRNVQYEQVASSYLNKLAESRKKANTRSAQQVMRVVQSHTRALQDCYKQELRYNPDTRGKIVVRFTVDPDGIVTTASVVSSTLNSPRMEECIINRIKRWRNFPPCDPSVGNKTYRQSFSFRN